jgi:predicted nucleotidyltransferase
MDLFNLHEEIIEFYNLKYGAKSKYIFTSIAKLEGSTTSDLYELIWPILKAYSRQTIYFTKHFYDNKFFLEK